MTIKPEEVPLMPDTVRGRVDYFVGLMESQRFERGKTVYVVAAAWGLSDSTVSNYSAEASRIVAGDELDVRREIGAGGRRLMRRAESEGDYQGWKAVSELMAKVTGAMAPERTEHKVASVTLDDLDERRRAAEKNEE